MAAPAWFPAAAANATALSNAARTAAHSSPRRVCKQLASSSPVVPSGAGGRASALDVSGRVTSIRSRWLCWTPPERNYQLPELQYSCCSRSVLRQRQEQWTLPSITRNSSQVFSQPPYYCCPAADAVGTSPHDTWHFPAPRLYLSRIAGANREFSNTVRQAAGAALHVSSKATSDQQLPQEGSADGVDGGRCADTDFAHAAPAKKMAAVMLLRRRSGGVSVGECLKALEATNGDTEAAIVHLRKQGLSKAAARSATDYGAGLVAVGVIEESPTAASSAAAAGAGRPLPAAAGRGRRMSSVLVALTSQTDFVAANARFVALAQQVARTAARTAAAEAATAADGRTTVVGAKQSGFCSRASVTKAEDTSKRNIKDVATASFLEAVKAATVSESLLTVEEIDVPEVAPAGAAKKATAVSETAALTIADASLSDTNLTLERGTGSDSNGTISVSSALALLSQQFGEDVQLSDIKALVVEEQPQQPQQCQGELHTDNSSACNNATVGVYIHGQVAKNVGRAGAMVCLRWRSEITSPHLQSTAPEAQQLETVTRTKMERLAQLLCMQVIATRPRYVKLADISPAERNAERDILIGAAAAAAAKRRAPASSTTVPAPVVVTGEEVPSPPAAGAARGGSLTKADAVIEARLEGTLREQTLLEQEFLPLGRFHAEIHTCNGISNNSSCNSASGHQSSDTNLSRVTSTAGTVSCKNSAASIPSRLTVKEALKRAAVALRCSSIDVESMECLSVGQS